MLPIFVFVFLSAPRVHYQTSLQAALAVILWDLNFVSLGTCFVKSRGNDATYLEYDNVCVCGGGGSNQVKTLVCKCKIFCGTK
jgi:hypothetical protein